MTKASHSHSLDVVFFLSGESVAVGLEQILEINLANNAEEPPAVLPPPPLRWTITLGFQNSLHYLHYWEPESLVSIAATYQWVFGQVNYESLSSPTPFLYFFAKEDVICPLIAFN